MQELKELFKMVFDIFTTLMFLGTLISCGIQLSDSYDMNSTAIAATMLTIMLLLCGSYMLIYTFIFKNPIPLPMQAMFCIIALGVFILMWFSFREEEKNKNLDKVVEKISNVTLDELHDKFKNIQSVRTKSINAELDTLLEKLSVIDNTDNVTIYKKAQSFANKYLTILYVSVDNYAKLNNPDKKITNTILSTLKTVNAALDKIISESDELLQDDINSTAEAIKVLLEPAVSENPFKLERQNES